MTTPDAATVALKERLKDVWGQTLRHTHYDEEAAWLAVAREAQRWYEERILDQFGYADDDRPRA